MKQPSPVHVKIESKLPKAHFLLFQGTWREKTTRWILACAFLLVPGAILAQEILRFYDTAVRCDYLVIAPAVFKQGAYRLVEYRNGMGRDDVRNGRLATVENMLAEYPSPNVHPDTALRTMLAWAAAHWAEPPRYVVLLGSDSAQTPDPDTIRTNSGPMPTHISEFDPYIGHLNYGDDWYAIDTIPVSDSMRVAVGRIPCETPGELDAYLDKLVAYEATPNGLWRNKVLVMADDDSIRPFLDQIDHQSNACNVAALLSGREVSNLYLSTYQVDENGEHAAGRTAFFDYVNGDIAWTIFFGHGHPAKLTDESVLRAADWTRFSPNAKPTIFFSFSCSNGAFYRHSDSSMVKKFLFAQGGPAAYVACPNTSYASTGEGIMRRVIACRDSYPQLSLGHLLARAKRYTAGAWNPYEAYQVFGDPALMAGPRVASMNGHLPGDGTIAFEAGTSLSGSCAWSIVQSSTTLIGRRNITVDSILASGQGRFDRAIAIPLPLQASTDLVRVKLYAWNDSTEARHVMELGASPTHSFPNAVLSSFSPIALPEESSATAALSADSVLVTLSRERDEVRSWVLGEGGVTRSHVLARRDADSYFRSVYSSPGSWVYATSARRSENGEGWQPGFAVHKLSLRGSRHWTLSQPDSFYLADLCALREGGCAIWCIPSGGAGEARVVRIDSLGAVAWDVRIPYHGYGGQLIQTNDGGIVLCGSNPDTSLVPYRFDLFLVRLTLGGTIVWQKTVATPGASVSVNAVCAAGDGTWIVAGTRSVSTGNSDRIFLARIDASGDTLWTRAFGGASGDGAYSIDPLGSGLFAIGCRNAWERSLLMIVDLDGVVQRSVAQPFGGWFRVVKQLDQGRQLLMALCRTYEGGEYGESYGVLTLADRVALRDLPRVVAAKPRAAVYVCARGGGTMAFRVARRANLPARVEVYSVNGRLLCSLDLGPGQETVTWIPAGLAQGIYVARAMVNGYKMRSVAFSFRR
jgi:hypothetical protein